MQNQQSANEPCLGRTDQTRLADGAETVQQHSGITPMNLLIGIAKNFRWLVIVPLVIGGIAYGLASFLPKKYTSASYLVLNDAQARATESLMRTPMVLDPVLARFPASDMTIEASRRQLLSKIRFSAAPGDVRRTATLFVFEVEDQDAARAQALNKAFVETWIEKSRPRGIGLTRMRDALKRSEAQLESISNLISRFEREATTVVTPGSIQGEIVTPLANLIAQRERLVDVIVKLQVDIAGITDDVVAVPAQLPTESSSPKRGIIALLAAVLSGLLMLGFLLVRVAINHASPTVQGNIKRLKSAI